MFFITDNTEETEKLDRRLAEKIDSLGLSRAYIALRGEMGVGKTAFVRGLASQFGISNVKSPTYTVVNEYRGKKNVYHFDMYRIESEDDLYSIGFDEYVDKDGICISEWSENIEDFIPENAIFVSIKRSSENEAKREIEILWDGLNENISI
jgi:tRNA threonylcarbamoyladenosine biosynthesis protein TsaE